MGLTQRDQTITQTETGDLAQGLCRGTTGTEWWGSKHTTD